METKKTNSKSKKNNGDWTDFVKDVVVKNIEEISETFLKNVQKKTSEFVLHVVEAINLKILSSLFFFVGFLFLMVGIALTINDLIQLSPGIGYLIVGFLVVLISILLNERIHDNNK